MNQRLRTMGDPVQGAPLLRDVRPLLSDALAPLSDADPEVLTELVDAVSPPCLMVEWGDPWLEPQTVGQGYWYARLAVLCIASRVEPGPGVDTLEELVLYVVARLDGDARSWPVESAAAPRRFDMAGLTYLGARVIVRVPVTVGG